MVRKGWLLPLAHLMGISTVVNRFAATLQLPGCLRENGCCLELVTPRGCQSAVLAVWCATHPGDTAWGSSSACLPGWGCSALPSGILLCDCQITRVWAAASLEVAWEEKGHNPDWKKGCKKVSKSDGVFAWGVEWGQEQGGIKKVWRMERKRNELLLVKTTSN